MRLFRPLLACLAVLLAAGGCAGAARAPAPLRVGAVYPLSGAQGMGGVDEYRGVLVAAELANHDGGVGGRRIAVERVDVPEADAAPGAVAALAGRGAGIGLANVHARLQSTFGPEYGLEVESPPGGGTVVRMLVPKFRAGVRAA
jgi:two-component system LytT family sensor kinase